MRPEKEILSPGLEEYPKAGIIRSNLIMALWLALGTVAIWFFSPLLAWVYLASAVTTVFLVLRALVCTNCYYYGRWCATGWGKLASLFFKQGSIERFKDCIGVKLAPAAYGLLSFIPMIFLIISAIQKITVPKAIVLMLLLFVSFYSGAVSRGKACVSCRMRAICPGASKDE